MNYKTKIIIFSLITLLSLKTLYAHCQLPCGIYDDKRKFEEIKEDVSTISKSIAEIKKISAIQNKSESDNNQLIRWVINKETHSDEIINQMTNYFLTQRIKIKEQNEVGYSKYIEMITITHKIIFYSMKLKQEVNPETINKINNLISNLETIYYQQ